MHGGKKREQTRERKDGLGKKEPYSSPPPKKKKIITQHRKKLFL